jgi:rhodanese-related sulfurtransferase
LKTLELEEAVRLTDAGAAFVDLRDVDPYLEVHIPRSIDLMYEFGPGMASRARDCLPMSLRLVILDLGVGDVGHAAASLRGKGFEVLGRLNDGINRWAHERGAPASAEVVRSPTPPGGLLLDVGDPGVVMTTDLGIRIPLERLWDRVDELKDRDRVVVAAGYGVRAALAVGILERAGHEVAFWKTRA